MAVSNYLAKSEYGCRYHYDKLKNVVYLVSEDHVKDIIIDNGEAYISGLSETPLRIEGFGIDFREETSLDERYRFQKTLNLSIEGVPEISAGFRWTNIDPNEDYWCENFNKYYKQVLEENIVDIYQKYYLIVESKDGTFFMVNVDFPSDASYTYNLSKNSNQTTFSFSSVSNFPTLKLNGFNPESTSDCKVYKNNYIKDTVYLVSEDNIGNVFVDGSQSYVSGLTETPLKLNGFNAEFKEEVSFDERYRFQKTLTISIDGYATFEVLNQKYYPIVEAKDGTFLMLNVDFPSKVTHTYNLSRGINQTDFTFSTLSNFPLMKLIGFNPNDTVLCKPYKVNGAEGLRMLEAARVDFSEATNEIISTEPFKTVEYLGETLSLQEVYDGSKFATTLEFNIAFDAYKSSWQYNLLEFVMNKYAAIIGIKGSSNKIYTGFKEGLEPNYTITANATQGQSDIITLRLVEMSNRGLVIGDLGERIITDKHWRYVSKVGNIHSYECDGFGYAIYLLQEECDYFGNPTGRYKVLEGYADRFSTLNIIGTFDEEVYFYHPYCGSVASSDIYLTLVAQASGTFTFTKNASAGDIQYSKNGGAWTTGTAVTVSNGDEVRWKGDMTPSSNGIGTFSSTGGFTAKNNVMSLLFGDDFKNKTDLTGKDRAFRMLFYQCSTLSSINGLVLPATTLSSSCYQEMFYGTSLKSIPSDLLPATTLSSSCYYQMFWNCPSLTSIPSGLLPATTLADYCYQEMFAMCPSLTSIPSNLLPATTLANNCYSSMFWSCQSLTSIPSNLLQATTLANNCYSGMFAACTGITTVPSNLLPATTLANSCYYHMFWNCTSLTSVPSNLLPATTLAVGCYAFMFEGCSNLTTAPDLPATTLAEFCYSNMFLNCTSLTSVPSNLLPATTLAEYCYIDMFNGCTSLTTAPELPATTLVKNCYYQMFENCTSLTTAPKLPATTLVKNCYYQMFEGCTSLTTAPDLPATTLVQNCYLRMFYYCSSLNYIKCLATNVSATDCTDSWVQGVSATGTFVKNASMTGWPTGNDGIPNGWTVQNAT